MQTTLTIDSFVGHIGKLPRAAALVGGPGFVVPNSTQQTGVTSTTLTFTHDDDGSGPQAFHRLLIDP